MTRLLLIFTAGALLFACAAYAQQTPLLGWNVVAMDSHGQPVADLTSADFEISDAGRTEPIVYFHAAAGAVSPKSNAAPNEHSNRAGVCLSHATVMIFDLLNADNTDRGFAWNEIARSLESRESSDFLYLYLLTREGKLYPVHPLPDSMAELKPADTPWTKRIKPLLDNAMKAVNRLRLGGIVDDDRVKMTYNALNQVVSTLEMVPGRKNIVWISRGVPISLRLAAGADQIDYAPLLRKLSDRCIQAKVTAYTVNQSSSATPSAAELTSVDTLQQLANLTGGRMFNTNDAAGRAVAQAMDEWRSSYILAYQPAVDNWDGKPHKIRVTCARKGVNLQFPQSYYAERPVATDRMRAALQPAVTSPFDSPETGLDVIVGPAAKPGVAHFQVRIDPADVWLREQGDHSVARLVVVLVDYGAQGPKSVSQPAALDVSMTKEQGEAAARDGIRVTEDRPIADGVERMRLIVYDPALNRLGSITVPVGAR